MFSIETTYYDENGQAHTDKVFDDVLIDQKYKVVDPQLELEDNSAGSLEFTIYTTNNAYGSMSDSEYDPITVLRSTIRVYMTNGTKEEIWEGRPLSIKKDFYNGKQVYCEGALSYLNDIHQPVKEYVGLGNGDVELIEYVNGVLEEYNKYAALNRRFDTSKTYVNPVGIPRICTLKDPVSTVDQLPIDENTKDYDLRQIGDSSSHVYYMYTTLTGWKDVSKSIYHTMGSFYKTSGEKTKDAIGVLVSSFGGHVKVVTIGDSRCLYYTANADPEDAYLYPEGTQANVTHGSNQTVKFGKNLLDITKNKDGSNFFTVLLPVGAEIGSSHETIESMCPNYLEDKDVITNLLAIYPGSDLFVDRRIAPFDTVCQMGVESRNEINSNIPIKRKVMGFDISQELNGYDFFLNTTSFLRAEIDSTYGHNTNTLFYSLLDRSAEDSSISIIGSNQDYPGKGMGYGVGNSGMSTPYWSSGTYANNRPILRKQMSQNTWIRQSLVDERIQIPSIGLYTFQFSVGDAYALIGHRSDGSGKRQMPDDKYEWKDTYDLLYPTFYRMPYKRENPIASGMRRIPRSDIRWHGGSPRDDHIDWTTNPGVEHATTTEPYRSYGLDDCDIVPNRGTTPYGEVIIVAADDKNAFYLNQFYPFAVDPSRYPDSILQPAPVPSFWMINGAYDNRKLFTTGHTGHHVGKINVEPGRTYYLTTRVTSVPYPTVNWEERLNPAYQAFYDSGELKEKYSFKTVVYAVVARNYDTVNSRWYYEMLSYKEVTDTYIATDLFMEEIKIPDSILSEEYVSDDTPGWEDTKHLELWFTCDQCYINGCANLDPNATDSQGNPIPVGYEPELYILDKDASNNSQKEKTDYQDKVTIAPLQRPKNSDGTNNKDPRTDDPAYPDNFGFSYEYLVNREMYEKYGPIVKKAEYSDATTPEKLMEYANVEMRSMTEDPSFEVSAIDLKTCGVENCDSFRLLQKVKIDTNPHGIDQSVTLTKMSMNLADMSSNSYTFGYDATTNISTIRNEN